MPLSRIVRLATVIASAGLLSCNGSSSTPTTTGVIGMSLGGDHSCENSYDNGMRCWGNNASGQLGNGTNTSSVVPVEPTPFGSGPSGTGGGAYIQDFATGGAHTCVIGSRGKIFCWGSNFYGQLGVDSKIDYKSPQPVRPVTVLGDTTPLGATFVAAGNDHTCALYSGGNVACWGRFYALKPTTWVPGLTVPIEVKAGGNQTCVREHGGTVKCWRMLATTTPSPAIVPGVSAKKIAVGQYHACAIDQSDALKCWGSNTLAQLGNGSHLNTSAVVSVIRSGPSDTPVDIAAGQFHTCALFASGAVECWGNNATGETGQPGGTGSTVTPFRVIATGASGVAAGSVHSCARIDDGNVRRMKCWGSNADGRLGNGSASQFSVTPVQVSGLP